MEELFPDSFGILHNVLGSRGSGNDRQLKLRSESRNGYIWIDEAEVPESMVAAYDLKVSDRQARK